MNILQSYLILLKEEIAKYKKDILHFEISGVTICIKENQWCLVYILKRGNILINTESIIKYYKRRFINVTFIYR